MTPLEIAFEKGNPRIIHLLSNADIPDSVFDEVQHIDDDNVFEFVKDIAAPDGKIDSKLQSKIMKDPHGDNNNAGSNQHSKVPHTKKKNKKKKEKRRYKQKQPCNKDNCLEKYYNEHDLEDHKLKKHVNFKSRGKNMERINQWNQKMCGQSVMSDEFSETSDKASSARRRPRKSLTPRKTIHSSTPIDTVANEKKQSDQLLVTQEDQSSHPLDKDIPTIQTNKQDDVISKPEQNQMIQRTIKNHSQQDLNIKLNDEPINTANVAITIVPKDNTTQKQTDISSHGDNSNQNTRKVEGSNNKANKNRQIGAVQRRGKDMKVLKKHRKNMTSKKKRQNNATRTINRPEDSEISKRIYTSHTSHNRRAVSKIAGLEPKTRSERKTFKLTDGSTQNKTRIEMAKQSAHDISYKCMKCKKIFKSRQNLKEHAVVHSGIASFACEYCDKAYKRRKDMYHHIRNMHPHVSVVLRGRHCEILDRNTESTKASAEKECKTEQVEDVQKPAQQDEGATHTDIQSYNINLVESQAMLENMHTCGTSGDVMLTQEDFSEKLNDYEETMEQMTNPPQREHCNERQLNVSDDSVKGGDQNINDTGTLFKLKSGSSTHIQRYVSQQQKDLSSPNLEIGKISGHAQITDPQKKDLMHHVLGLKSAWPTLDGDPHVKNIQMKLSLNENDWMSGQESSNELTATSQDNIRIQQSADELHEKIDQTKTQDKVYSAETRCIKTFNTTLTKNTIMANKVNNHAEEDSISDKEHKKLLRGDDIDTQPHVVTVTCDNNANGGELSIRDNTVYNETIQHQKDKCDHLGETKLGSSFQHVQGSRESVTDESGRPSEGNTQQTMHECMIASTTKTEKHNAIALVAVDCNSATGSVGSNYIEVFGKRKGTDNIGRQKKKMKRETIADITRGTPPSLFPQTMGTSCKGLMVGGKREATSDCGIQLDSDDNQITQTDSDIGSRNELSKVTEGIAQESLTTRNGINDANMSNTIATDVEKIIEHSACIESNTINKNGDFEDHCQIKQESYSHGVAQKTKKEQVFPCNECKKTYTERRNLTRHIKDHHTNQETFVCAKCSKVFKTRQNLREHANRVHKAVAVWHQCKYCDKKYKQRKDLNFHVRKKH